MILEHRKQSVNDITEMNYIGFQNAIALLAIGDVEILFAKESCVDIRSPSGRIRLPKLASDPASPAFFISIILGSAESNLY
jgi:hypothetical protein